MRWANPVEGAPVRFLVTRGDGTLSPGVAVAAEDGIAESVFRAGSTPGESEIRVDVPSAPNVSPLKFIVLAEAADSVLLSLVEGDAQRAEVGSQLPLPFVISTRTMGDTPAGGVEITFRLAGGGSVVLTNDAILTDTDGLGHTVLTLGRETRNYRVEAFASGGVYSDTVSFTATAVTSLDGPVGIDSVGVGLVAGAQATVFGHGFSPVPTENEVRIEGIPASVISATGSQLTIGVPAFAGECLPEREVGVRVLVGADASNGLLLPLVPAETAIGLEVGEALTLRGPAAVECLQFAPAENPRDFRLVIANLSRVAAGQLSMRLAKRAPADLSATRVARAVVPRELDAGLAEAALAETWANIVIRSRTLDGLTRSRVAASRAQANPAALSIPALGDTLEHFFAVGATLAATCSDTTNVVRGQVRAVGEHLVLVEDLAAPAGGLSAEEWTALGEELDQSVVPVDTAYFGAYADIDANGKVVVLFTPEVNKLGDGEAGVGGFFLPLDLAASGRGGGGLPGPAGEVCPASNEAEIVYIVTADPDGRVGARIDKARALRNARGLVAHELQHLISAERRVLQSPAGFGAVEEVWLDEALSGIAEEVVGLAAIGRSVGGNHTFDQVANTRAEFDAFNTYHLSNFLNLSFYMFSPSTAPTIAAVDPGGAGSLQMRGFGWFLTRWLADQAGGDERAFFRSIVGGGQNFSQGISNLERVTGSEWGDLLSDFAVALAADDAGIEELPSRFFIATWHFRDVFASLNQNTTAGSLFPVPFPLQATPLSFETGALGFDVGASSVRYFSLVSGLDAPALAVALGRPTGGPLGENTEPQITIVRTR